MAEKREQQKIRVKIVGLVLFTVLFLNSLPPLVSCCVSADKPAGKASPNTASVVRYTFRVKAVFDHDPKAFTQGLELINNTLYESTGLFGKSSVREVVLENGDILRRHNLERRYFGEGLTVMGDRIYQLTWKAGTCFVYDRDTFEERQRFTYKTQGWGLTHNSTHLIMSDGSNTLYFRDPDSFAVLRSLSVTCRGAPLKMLNELEYINGIIYANVWQTDFIAMINPADGTVVGLADLSGILTPYSGAGTVDVLNGIAYDRKNDRLFVTGKLWPKLFEIELVENGN